MWQIVTGRIGRLPEREGDLPGDPIFRGRSGSMALERKLSPVTSLGWVFRSFGHFSDDPYLHSFNKLTAC